MVRMIPLLDAKKLADKNGKEHQRLLRKKQQADHRAKKAQEKLNDAYTKAFENFLSPFATTFTKIKNVELGDLPSATAVPELNNVDVRLRAVGLKAVDALAALAGGSAAGAATGGLTFAAVGALATASTGAAIGGLSGAAATSATLAWLGGGSIAAGGAGVAGGTMVLTGIVAAPLLVAAGGFLWWKGNRALQDQKRVHEDLRRAEAELDVQLHKSSIAVARVNDTARVSRRLVEVGRVRLPQLHKLVASNPDYLTYSANERGRLAELAALATTIAAVIACPILDENGIITALSHETLQAAGSVADRMAA